MQHQTLLCNSIKNTSGSVRRKVENRISTELFRWRECKNRVVSVGLSVTWRWEYTIQRSLYAYCAFVELRAIGDQLRERIFFINWIFFQSSSHMCTRRGIHSTIAVLGSVNTQSLWSRHASWKQLTSRHTVSQDQTCKHVTEGAVCW